MKNKLESLWAKSRSIMVVDLGNDFFSIKFASLEDLSIALTGGPWVLMGHYLAIRKWEPCFNPQKANIHRVAAWIRLPGIPQEVCEYSFLNHLGNVIGKVIKVDKTTSNGERGKFARVCVDLDLSLPLRGEYFLEDEIFKVEYEGLYLICLKCGKYGHNVDNCPECSKPVEVKGVPEEKKVEPEESLLKQGIGPWMVKASAWKPVSSGVNLNLKVNSSSTQQHSSFSGTVENSVSAHSNKVGGKKVEVSADFIFSSDASSSGTKEYLKLGSLESNGKVSFSKSKNLKNRRAITRSIGVDSGHIGIEYPSPSVLGIHHEDNSKSSVMPEKDKSVIVVDGVEISEDIPPDILIRAENISIGELVGMEIERVEDPLNSDFIMESTQELSNPGTFYVIPKEEVREALWIDLIRIGDSVIGPWMMMGDFNEIVSPKEKIGGAPFNLARSLKFAVVLNDCNVVDIGCRGSKFSWRGPKWLHLDRVFKRLDMVCANAAWRTTFAEAYVRNLPRLNSDHNPLLVSFFPTRHKWRDRPFRFIAAWQEHSSFPHFLKDVWCSDLNINQSLDFLVEQLKSWNRRVFGCIQIRKDFLLRKLQETQLRSLHNSDEGCLAFEEAIQKELNLVLEQEETLWFQKARCKWIEDGDRNTTFYHTTTIIRRAKNKILELKNDEGHFVREEDNLLKLILAFFGKLYSEDCFCRPWISTKHSWPALDNSDLEGLRLSISDVEIKKIFFSMGALKAPDPDRFPALFFQKNWHLVEKRVCDSVKSMWNNPVGIKEEMIHSMSRMRGKRGFFAIKIDLEKAYDRISWRFIREVLTEIKLPESFIELIMYCISFSELEILWNGAKGGSFSPSRGIRQRDLISPYIFVLCMEKLSHIIADAVEKREWNPMKAASTNQIDSVMNCLNSFGEASGQKVSMLKSNIFFSKNVSNDLAIDIVERSGFARTKNIGRYLGYKMKHGRIGKSHYGDIMDRVNSRLSGWKKQCLSMAGRLILAKFVIYAIPMFSMHNSLLPVAIVQAIEKLQRNFIWGDSDNHRRQHLIAWECLQLPKEVGGLGIINLKKQNEAFFHKNIWNLINNPSQLWTQVILAKYGRKNEVAKNVSVKAYDSHFWRGMCRVWFDAVENFNWQVGNGQHVSFWTDKWAGLEYNLLYYAKSIPEDTEIELKADHSTFSSPEGWDINYLSRFFNAEICNVILAIPPPDVEREADCLVWKNWSPSFSMVRMAYIKLMNFPKSNLNENWGKIGKWSGQERIKIFMWKLNHGRLLTKERITKWGSTSDRCKHCPGK
ncbi:uncharacterized protein LOC133313766 [Gastrolobium bilobum]|uniref:uncharacterized protein LOC133313766 n=1 Tax=Gastrolobium bilobum TaxID=150636 RepID=UPI002AB26EE2|nr:uncharacterized protein LOC133313766 [Gastrolobium bilobum]